MGIVIASILAFTVGTFLSVTALGIECAGRRFCRFTGALLGVANFTGCTDFAVAVAGAVIAELAFVADIAGCSADAAVRIGAEIFALIVHTNLIIAACIQFSAFFTDFAFFANSGASSRLADFPSLACGIAVTRFCLANAVNALFIF